MLHASGTVSGRDFQRPGKPSGDRFSALKGARWGTTSEPLSAISQNGNDWITSWVDNVRMTRNQARFFVVCALVVLLSGLGIVATGNAFGWILAAIGAVNGVLSLISLRKSKQPLD
ncbi:hypothetical protein ABIB54_003348 [Frigoribacterium sp. UYMn621]